MDDPKGSSRHPSGSSSAPGRQNLLQRLDDLYRDGFTHAAIALSSNLNEINLEHEAFSKALILRGMAQFDAGKAVDALRTLEAAVETSAKAALRVQFDAAFALFVRAT